MALVKLDATTSTNDFLKKMAAEEATENFTVVTAESQSDGRGQMGAKWVSQKGKNLMMSILIKDLIISTDQLFSLNVAVSLAVIEALEKYDISQLSVKWPNDIMSGNRKIGGILIESSFKTDGKIISIVGIGLNVNQADFDDLPKAGSLLTVTGRTFDKDAICETIIEKITRNTYFLEEHAEVLWAAYTRNLFKFEIPTAFETPDGIRFMGIITDVGRNGKLTVKLEDESIRTFAVKEIQMLY